MEIKIALAGNPNCGKTTLFNQLTGSNQHVGNFPRVTVDREGGVIRGHREGTGTDVPMHAAGITLMGGDPKLVAAALDISHRTVLKIRQNLFWAFAYNVAGIPLAALGYLSPVVAGAAMALSSVSVMPSARQPMRWRR